MAKLEKKIILTDCFGVVVGRCAAAVFAKYYGEEKANAMTPSYFDEADRGVVTLDEVLMRMSKDLHVPFPEIKHEYFTIAKPHRVYLDTLRDLKKEGYPVWMLSDTSDTIVEYLLKEYDIEDVFEKKYLSYLTHLTKATPEAFLHVIRDNPYSPENYLFLDDNPHNIERAKSVGMNTLLFTEENETSKKLKEILLG